VTHNLIELSTFQVISVKSGVFCPWLLSQNWRSVTKWIETEERELVGVVTNVKAQLKCPLSSSIKMTTLISHSLY
ncbi:hypothetical protein, partial [Serratia nevei]|uniref:hypothetical protein n=1 Tax=Serratia nevei TaxID=2703794 RepID=UPI002AA0BFE5